MHKEEIAEEKSYGDSDAEPDNFQQPAQQFHNVEPPPTFMREAT